MNTKYPGIKKAENDSFYFITDLPSPDGRRKQARRRGFKTKREAFEAKVELESKARRGELVEKSTQTLGDFLQEWLQTIEPTVRPSTHYSYKRNMQLHVSPHIGGARLQHVDPGALNSLYAQLLVSGNQNRPGQGLSPRTVRYIATILHRAFKDAVRWGRLTRNPADAADPPRDDKATQQLAMKTWMPKQLGDFLDCSARENDRYYATWVLLATTGMRRGEALGLRWSDVDLDTGVVSIRQTLIVVNHQPRIGTPKTAQSSRSIDLDPGTVATLKNHRKRQLEERMQMGEGWADHDLVFTKPTGEPTHPERVSREFTRRIERYGLQRISLHDLRHTWATLALKALVHPKVVQERLGHATIGITLDTYSHVTAGMQREAAVTVVDLITHRLA